MPTYSTRASRILAQLNITLLNLLLNVPNDPRYEMSDLTHDTTTSKLLRLADVMAGIAAQVCGECYRRKRGERPSPATVRRDMLRVAVAEYIAERDRVVYFSREVCTDAEPTATGGSDTPATEEA